MTLLYAVGILQTFLLNRQWTLDLQGDVRTLSVVLPVYRSQDTLEKHYNRDFMHTIIIHQLPFSIGDETPEYSGAWREGERRPA